MKTIPLTRGLVALVDDQDFEFLSQWKWHATASADNYPYAGRREKSGERRYVYMHRLLLNATEGEDVDHVDGNSLNNHKSNLRVASRSQNIANSKLSTNNTSGFKGVYFNKHCKRWQAYHTCKGKVTYIGVFTTPRDAAKARDAVAFREFGAFARTNKTLGLL